MNMAEMFVVQSKEPSNESVHDSGLLRGIEASLTIFVSNEKFAMAGNLKRAVVWINLVSPETACSDHETQADFTLPTATR
jgi:hypothetical protein